MEQPSLWDNSKACENTMQSIPFVIDNQRHCMSNVLNTLLTLYKGQSLDIATASFTIEGWQLLAEGIDKMGSFRLLLGGVLEIGADSGLRAAGAKPLKGLIENFSDAPFDERLLRLIEDLTAFLREEQVQVRLFTQGVLHANGYLFSLGGGCDPIAAIIGSSTFTQAGLLTDTVLNLIHRVNRVREEISLQRLRGLLEREERKRLGQLDPADRIRAANVPAVLALNELTVWYEQQWQLARDFKEDLIDLLDATKFGHNASALDSLDRNELPAPNDAYSGTPIVPDAPTHRNSIA